MKAEIKDWFDNQLADKFNLGTLYHLDIFCGIKETEKAVYAMFYTGYDRNGVTAHHRCGWIPKSAIENLDSLDFIPDYDKAVEQFNLAYTM